MPTLQKAFNIFRSAAPFPAFSGVNGQIDHAEVGLAGGVSGDGGLRVAAIWIAVTVLADEIASLNYRIVRKGDNTRTPLEPPNLRPLWDDSPNLVDTRFSIDNSEVISLMLHGASYTMLEWQGAALANRWVQPPEASSIKIEDDGRTLKLSVQGKGDLFNRPNQKPQFCYTPLYTMPGELQPISPVRMAAELAGLSRAYNQSAKRLMDRGFNPSAVVTADDYIDDPEARSISQRLERLHGGSARAGGVAVIGGKGMKIDKLGMTLADAEFIAQNEYVFKVLLALWRVPPTVAGMVDKPSTWGSGVAEFSRGLERFTLRPITQRRQGSMQKYITRPVDPSLSVRYIYDSLLSAAPKERAEIQRANLIAGLTSVERVLAQNDEPPFDEDETVFSQLSMATDENREYRTQRDRAAALGEEAKAVSLMHAAGVPIEDAWQFVNPTAPFIGSVEEPAAPVAAAPVAEPSGTSQNV